MMIAKNYTADLKNKEFCTQLTENIDYVFNMACNMAALALLKIIKLSVYCQYLILIY
jgi:hypothetical protein